MLSVLQAFIYSGEQYGAGEDEEEDEEDNDNQQSDPEWEEGEEGTAIRRRRFTDNRGAFVLEVGSSAVYCTHTAACSVRFDAGRLRCGEASYASGPCSDRLARRLLCSFGVRMNRWTMRPTRTRWPPFWTSTSHPGWSCATVPGCQAAARPSLMHRFVVVVVSSCCCVLFLLCMLLPLLLLLLLLRCAFVVET